MRCPQYHTAVQQKQGPPSSRGTKGLIPEQNTGQGGVGVFTVQVYLSIYLIFIIFKESIETSKIPLYITINIRLPSSPKKVYRQQSQQVLHLGLKNSKINKTKASVNTQTEIQRFKNILGSFQSTALI